LFISALLSVDKFVSFSAMFFSSESLPPEPEGLRYAADFVLRFPKRPESDDNRKPGVQDRDHTLPMRNGF
jgi:hypothetical protein